MRRTVIAFDLDDTLAVTKSPISDRMSALLGELLQRVQVCVITGGTFVQINKQVVQRLPVDADSLSRLHLMPTCGTRYYRYDQATTQWALQYAEDLSDEQKVEIIEVLQAGAKELGLWEEDPAGEMIEDRDSQITYSALGQLATPEAKYAWDGDGSKKHALRDYAEAHLENLAIRVGGTTSVDVTNIGIDKAFGMGKLLEVLGINKTEVLFLGDKLDVGGNDYPVKAMGIDSIAVTSWEDTALVIEGINGVT